MRLHKSLTVSIVLAMSVSYTAQAQNAESVKGPVSYEDATLYRPSIKYGKLDEGNSVANYKNLYDEKKNLIYSYKKQEYSSDNERTYYFYAPQGNVSKSVSIKGIYNDYNQTFTYEVYEYLHYYKYDSKGRAIEDNIYKVHKEEAIYLNGDTVLYGKIINTYNSNGQKTTKYYDNTGTEVKDEQKASFMDVAGSGSANKNATELGFTSKVWNVKRDSHGNAIHYEEQVKGWGADVKSKVDVTYKYDKYGNCTYWLKKSQDDTKFVGLQLTDATRYASMHKDIMYSTDTDEYKRVKEDIYVWLTNFKVCPEEVLSEYCGNEAKTVIRLYEEKKYREVLDQWCNTCKCFKADRLSDIYDRSAEFVYRDLESKVDKLKRKGEYREVVKYLEEMKDLIIAAEMKDNEDNQVRDTNSIIAEIEYYNTKAIELEDDEYKRQAQELIKQHKYDEAKVVLNKVFYKDDQTNWLVNQCNEGIESDKLNSAIELYEKGEYAKSIAIVNEVQRLPTYTNKFSIKEKDLTKKICTAVNIDVNKKSETVMKNIESKEYQKALETITTLKSDYKIFFESNNFCNINSQYLDDSRITCEKGIKCQNAEAAYSKASSLKKEWNKVVEILDEYTKSDYSHCDCQKKILKLSEKAKGK